MSILINRTLSCKLGLAVVSNTLAPESANTAISSIITTSVFLDCFSTTWRVDRRNASVWAVSIGCSPERGDNLRRSKISTLGFAFGPGFEFREFLKTLPAPAETLCSVLSILRRRLLEAKPLTTENLGILSALDLEIVDADCRSTPPACASLPLRSPSD